MVRTVEPWGVVSWRGRWYAVGHDRDRQAPRCFRLSRVVGDVELLGRPGAVDRPAGINLMEYVLGASEEPRTTTTALLWVADGRAQGVRRHGKVVGSRALADVTGDELEIELYRPESAAGWIAGFGPDVVVLEPEVLRKSVRERLLGVLTAAGAR
jgi:proteasome accessory factor B